MVTAPAHVETPSAAPRRTFGPRRALPNSRAVVGALLVTLAAVGTFAVANGDDTAPGTSYLVLLRDIEAGDTLSVGDVDTVPMELAPELAATVLSGPSGLEGATALTSLRAGSLVDGRDIRSAPMVDGAPVASVHELTLPVPAERAPNDLIRGDRVTVLAYSSDDATLRTALEHALVLSYEVAVAGIGTSDSARLTLALTSADEVVNAALLSYDSLTVVLTSRVLGDDYPERLPPMIEGEPEDEGEMAA